MRLLRLDNYCRPITTSEIEKERERERERERASVFVCVIERGEIRKSFFASYTTFFCPRKLFFSKNMF